MEMQCNRNNGNVATPRARGLREVQLQLQLQPSAGSSFSSSSSKKLKLDEQYVRRNEREKKRIAMLNRGFEVLRKALPQTRRIDAENENERPAHTHNSHRLRPTRSKIATLRNAIDYIHHLERVLTQSKQA